MTPGCLPLEGRIDKTPGNQAARAVGENGMETNPYEAPGGDSAQVRRRHRLEISIVEAFLIAVLFLSIIFMPR